MLFNGEEIGDGSPPRVDIAVDPLEGTRLCAQGRPGALAVIALCRARLDVRSRPLRLHGEAGRRRRRSPTASASRIPIGDVVKRVAERRGVSPTEVTTVILDRERHDEGVRQIREAGSRIRFITDGDVAGALLAVSEGTGVDLLWGIGGTPEGVLSAAAIKCLGGQILGRLWPRDDDERKAAERRRLRDRPGPHVDDLVGGNDAFFAATGVTDGDLLQGVRYAARPRDHRVADHALPLGHGPQGPRPPRPGEAARGYGRPVRVAGSASNEPDRCSAPPATSGGLLVDELLARGRARPRPWRALPRRPRSDLEATPPRSFAATCSSPRRSAPALEGVVDRLLPRPLDGPRGRRRLRRARPPRRHELRRGGGRRPASSGSSTSAASARASPSTCAPATRRPRPWPPPGIPLTYFRAAVVIGSGSESLRTIAYLVKRLPAMVTPSWTDTKTQPIAAADVVAYLRRRPGRCRVGRPRDRDRRPRRDDLRRDARLAAEAMGTCAAGRGSACRCSRRR